MSQRNYRDVSEKVLTVFSLRDLWCNMDTIPYRACIEKMHIGFLNSIIESYEGIAVVRTFDADLGIVELWVSPWFELLVCNILHDLADEIGLQYLYKASTRQSS